ncbi:MAG: isoamylase early set domain-containing protein [Actinobacteria bacterium]|nr:isoamylase early set domain-containing protein [Actinomycetota bacterium]
MIKKTRAQSTGKVKVTFVLPSDHPPGPASVVGEFNGWNPYSNPFKRRSNKSYSTSVELDSGQRYRFRYLAAGGHWFDDDDVEEHELDLYGERNGIVRT